MRHVIEAQQFKREDLEELFAIADRCKDRQDEPLKGKILASLFYEPSTRTRLSFESAMMRLGGNVITTENAAEFSSAMKGETIEDSVRVVGSYADVIVMRHFEKGAAERGAAVSTVPLINAGDGAGQHPTQALLDMYTLKSELGKLDGLRVAMMGDLRNGRTVRSLCYLLGKYDNVHIDLVSPSELRVGDDIKAYLDKHHIKYEEHETFDEIIGEVDAIYQTRIQKERFASHLEYERLKNSYILTPRNTADMKEGAIIMHPLPRVNEISPALDTLPKAAYFRQVEYGVLLRIALLLHLLSE